MILKASSNIEQKRKSYKQNIMLLMTTGPWDMFEFHRVFVGPTKNIFDNTQYKYLESFK